VQGFRHIICKTSENSLGFATYIYSRILVAECTRRRAESAVVRAYMFLVHAYACIPAHPSLARRRALNNGNVCARCVRSF
jgi:hypothetical protein